VRLTGPSRKRGVLSSIAVWLDASEQVRERDESCSSWEDDMVERKREGKNYEYKRRVLFVTGSEMKTGFPSVTPFLFTREGPSITPDLAAMAQW
jgi:hypothetical protein